MKSFVQKLDNVQQMFETCKTPTERHHAIIELGKKLPQASPTIETEENLVSGCQSLVYLSAEERKGKIFFTASSDALISKGLAHLLLMVYSGESAEAILQQKPTFLTDLGILGALSPGRSNGLASIYLKMQQCALNFLVAR